MKSLPPEIYGKYQAVRKIVSKISPSRLITPSGCTELMVEILKSYKAENEFIKDFNGFDDRLPFKELLGE